MRAYVPLGEWEREEVELDEDTVHHLRNVLRLAPGDALDVFNGAGGLGRAVILAAGPRAMRLRIAERAVRPPPAVRVVLQPAMLREQKMDWLIQKAVELGASAIRPLQCERSLARVKPDQAGARLERWRRIVLHAARQSRAAWLPAVSPAREVTAALAEREDGLLLLGDLGPGSVPLREALARCRAAPPPAVAVWTGPEGDFTPEELRAVRAAGATPVSLGAEVLRAETAPLYILSALRYEFM